MPLATARRFLEDKRESDFDPACVDAFLARWDDVTTVATTQTAKRPLPIPATAIDIPDRLVPELCLPM
jgi:putative two-component system response regulator